MNPHPNALLPLDLVHLDHMVMSHCPSSENHTGVTSIRCDATRYVFLLAVKDLGLRTVIQHLINLMAITGRKIVEIYADHAFSNKPQFLTWAKSENIKVSKRVSNMSRGNKAERTNRWYHQKVLHFCENERQWHLKLHKIASSMNCQVNATTILKLL